LLGFFLNAVVELQRGVNAYKHHMKKVEENTVMSIQNQLTSVAVLLLAHLGVSQGGYQTLINATSWSSKNGGDRVIRILCPLGTPTSRWPPLRKVLAEIDATALNLGLVNMSKGAAHIDWKQVLIDQLRTLAKMGLIKIEEGATIWVQILCDATEI